MRSISFTLPDKIARDNLFDMMLSMVKTGDYKNDFEFRDIVISKWEGKGGYCTGIVVADNVLVSISIRSENTVEAGETLSKTMIDSEMFTDSIGIGNDIDISVSWKSDSVNRYKVVKTNFDLIKEMIREGKSHAEIGKYFGIELSEEECSMLSKKDKF